MVMSSDGFPKLVECATGVDGCKSEIVRGIYHTT